MHAKSFTLAGQRSVVAAILAIALGALALGLVESSGAAHRTYTVAFVAGGTPGSRDQAIARGGRAAAKALGIRFLLRGSPDPTATYTSLIARHVDAIATSGHDPSLDPILNKVRAAHILLLSSGDDIAAKRPLWVTQSGSVAYAQALADALASQIDHRGEYAILVQRDQWPVATEWQHLVQAYIAKTYPAMTLDRVVNGTGAGDASEVSALEAFMAAHPNLKGLIGITPTEAQVAAMAITQAAKIGQVFSAGNGGTSFSRPLPGWARTGAAEFVFVGDPVKLGYATVWAAHYVLTGHTFKPGAYRVGNPIGLVRYYAEHEEFRFGRPLTITKANADRYVGTF